MLKSTPLLRYFKCVDNTGISFGKFCGSNVNKTAEKAFSKIVDSKKDYKNGEKIEFSLIEMTNNIDGQNHLFEGSRNISSTPIKVLVDGKTVTQYHRISIKSKLEKKKKSMRHNKQEIIEMKDPEVDFDIKRN
jgi:hypothetical protein